MSLFSWKEGLTKELICGGKTGAFRIDSLEIEKDIVVASGAICVIDPTATEENRKKTALTWWASTARVATGPSVNWMVQKTRDTRRFCVDHTHDALCMIIRDELADYVAGHPMPEAALSTADLFASVSPPPVHVQEPELPKIEEPRPPCICPKLSASIVNNAFDPKSVGGLEYAAVAENPRCMICSCGQRWWLYKPELGIWARVADRIAWYTLMNQNNTVSDPLVFFLDSVYLAETLQDRKLNPKTCPFVIPVAA